MINYHSFFIFELFPKRNMPTQNIDYQRLLLAFTHRTTFTLILKNYQMKKMLWLSLFAFLVNVPFSFGQDPFFTHFYGNKSFFNPSLVGIVGSTSVGVRYKTQWKHQGTPTFRTMAVSFEESVPCSFFDYGVFGIVDEEGLSRFRTYDVGFRVAGTPAWDLGKSIHNLRIGFDFRWIWKSIDFNTLTFSDQLDPKYGTIDVNGIPNPTAFIPPDDNQTNRAFAPGVGLTYKILSTEKGSKPFTLMFGGSYHNTLSIGQQGTGHEDSILGIGTRIPGRWNAFAELELILHAKGNAFVSLKPIAFYQNQGSLDYYEAGAQIWLSRLISVGAYYHNNSRPQASNNAEWLSFRMETNAIGGRDSKVNLGFTYATNFKGLRNFVGPTFEVAVVWHFAMSPACNLAGLGDLVPYNKNSVRCTGIGARKKLYENIWFDENWQPFGKFK